MERKTDKKERGSESEREIESECEKRKKEREVRREKRKGGKERRRQSTRVPHLVFFLSLGVAHSVV